MNYDWIKDSQHTLTIRDRATGWAKQRKVWNHKVIEQVLAEQKQTEDIYITKYPNNRLVEKTGILPMENRVPTARPKRQKPVQFMRLH